MWPVITSYVQKYMQTKLCKWNGKDLNEKHCHMSLCSSPQWKCFLIFVPEGCHRKGLRCYRCSFLCGPCVSWQAFTKTHQISLLSTLSLSTSCTIWIWCAPCVQGLFGMWWASGKWWAHDHEHSNLSNRCKDRKENKKEKLRCRKRNLCLQSSLY